MGSAERPTDPYRDETAALGFRLERLHGELASLREARQAAEALARAEADILAEIEQVQDEVKRMRAKRTLPLLDLAYVASPCTADWNQMQGDERTRFCEPCGKNVHNLSAMSFDEAEAFLRQLTGEACIRVYRRKDGTVITQDCPVGIQKKRRRRNVAALVGGGLAISGLAATETLLDPVERVNRLLHSIDMDLIDDSPHVVQGGMVAPPPELFPHERAPQAPKKQHEAPPRFTSNAGKQSQALGAAVGASSKRSEPVVQSKPSEVHRPFRPNF